MTGLNCIWIYVLASPLFRAPLHVDFQALPRPLVNDSETLQLLTDGARVQHEIIPTSGSDPWPAVAADTRWPRADAGACAAPATSPLSTAGACGPSSSRVRRIPDNQSRHSAPALKYGASGATHVTRAVDFPSLQDCALRCYSKKDGRALRRPRRIGQFIVGAPMERFLAAGFRAFFVVSLLCLIASIAYFVWRQSWDLVGLLAGVLVVGAPCLALFLLPANLTSYATSWIAKRGWRLATRLALFVNLTLTNASCAIATIAVFSAVLWKGAPINQKWALVASFGAATFPGCWIAFREREAAGGLFLAFFAGLASAAMASALLWAPPLAIPSALCVYFLALIVNFAFTAPKVVPKKPRTAFDAVIFAMYGNPPPPNTADPTQAAALVEELLAGVVNGDEVKGATVRLNDKDMPFNTHELAVAVLLHFLRRKDLMPHLAQVQLGARLAALKWFEEGKINRVAIESFENVIYRAYQQVICAPSPPTRTASQSSRDARDNGTLKSPPSGTGGISTDAFPNGRGEFGLTATNPIPCRKEHGANVYLSRLRTTDGRKVLFRRIGAAQNDVSSHPIECYSIQLLDGQELVKLYLSLYQMRDSGKAPRGFTLAPT